MEREGGRRGRGEGEGVDPAQIPGKRHRSSPPSGPVVGEGGGREGGGEEGMGKRGGEGGIDPAYVAQTPAQEAAIQHRRPRC